MLTTLELERKAFVPGTTGWTADDLDDPEIERQWEAGSYEIVEGVLTLMPPALFDGSAALQNLTFLMQLHVRENTLGGSFAPETDFIVGRKRVARPDMVYLSEEDLRRQQALHARRDRAVPRKWKYGRLLVPPTLVVECLSEGHEAHDRETKWQWYAQFEVPNYWLLDPLRRTLECHVLRSGNYQLDAAGNNAEEVRPVSLFPKLVIPLSSLWL